MPFESSARRVVLTGALRHRGKRASYEKRVDADQSKSRLNWISGGAAVISFTSIFLILLGFGVSLAVEEAFGLPHAAVFDSAFDLAGLSSVAVGELVVLVVDGVKDGSIFIDLYTACAACLEFALGGLLVGAVGGLLYALWVRHFSQSLGWKQMRWRRWKAETKQLAWECVRAALAVLSAPVLVVSAFVIASAVLSAAPLLGMYAGRSHIEKWVIGPNRCLPMRDLQAMRDHPRRTPSVLENVTRVANCVALKKDKVLLGSGRLVVSTSKALVLVEESGQAKRFPTDGVVVEPVDSLPSI